MMTKQMRVWAAALSAAVLSAAVLTAAPSLVFTNLGGTVHVRQGVPCNGVVELTTAIDGGRLEITPLAGRRDGSSADFDLTRLDLFVRPFAVEDECLGITGAVEFREIGYRLVGAVRFTAEAIGRPEELRYRFSIPREQVLLFASVLDSLPVPQPEMQYQRPSEDVTGEIDLLSGRIQVHAVLTSALHFRAGCALGRCVIDEVLRGTQTADITGELAPPARGAR